MSKKLLLICLLLLSFLKPASAQTNCFQCINTKTELHSDTTAYLFMECNYYIFPDLLGVKKYKDDSSFQAMFKEKFNPYGLQQFSFINNDSTSTNLIVMSDANAIIIIFRGSEIKGGLRNIRKDWFKTDGNCKLMKVDAFNNSYVHSGFWKSYLSVRDTLLKTIMEHQPANKKIFITGHSLGGALAVLAAADLSTRQLKPYAVYTFANPRVGTQYFADYYTQLNIPTFRYVNENDLVPMLPPDKGFHKIFCPEADKSACGKYVHVGITYNIHKDGSIVANDKETRVPCKEYKLGKIKRHDLSEYCNKLYKFYFSNNDSLNVLPKPPVRKKLISD